LTHSPSQFFCRLTSGDECLGRLHEASKMKQTARSSFKLCP